MADLGLDNAYKKVSVALTQGTKVLTSASKSAGKFMSTALVKTADVVHLRNAINVTSKYGKKGATQGMKLIRKQFFAKYANIPISDLEEDEIDDEHILTDDELLEFVDARFFDKQFYPMEVEIDFFSTIEAESEREIRSYIEVHEVARKKEHDIIADTLKKRVLLQHKEFVDAVNQVCLVRNDLVETSGECASGRMKLKLAKEGIAIRGLSILKLDRRRHNLRAVDHIVDAMNKLHAHYDQAIQCLDAGQLVEAISILQSYKVENLDVLLQVKCMEPVVSKWQTLTTSPIALAPYVFNCIDACMVNFNSTTYVNIMEGVRMLHSSELTDLTFVKLRDATTEKAMGIMRKTLAEVSEVKQEATFMEIAAGIQPECILSCICKLCARLHDFWWLYLQFTKTHLGLSKSDVQGSDTDKLHLEALGYLKSGANELRFGYYMGIILQSMRLQSLNVDLAMHVIHVAMVFVESLQILGGKEPNYRDGIKEAAIRYLRVMSLQQQVTDTVRAMVEDSWEVEIEARSRYANMPILKPLNPKKIYIDEINRLRKYFDGPVSSPTSNPFFDVQYLQAQNQDLDTDLFQSSEFCDPHRASFPFSAEGICTYIFKTVARVVIRLPPLASDVLCMFEDLIFSYIYVVAGSHVVFSREIPIEMQADYTPDVRIAFRIMRERAEKLVSAQQRKEGLSIFPPFIFSETCYRTIYQNEKKFYGLVNRVTAIESIVSVISLYRATIESIKNVLTNSVIEPHREQCRVMRLCGNQLLEVAQHYLCKAIMDKIDFSKLRVDKDNTKVIQEIVHAFTKFLKNIALEVEKFPTQHSANTFWCRAYFVLLEGIIAWISSKKIPQDKLIKLSEEFSLLQTELKRALPAVKLSSFEKYISNFINSGLLDEAGKEVWLSENHYQYKAMYLIQFLGGSNPEGKAMIDAALRKINHEDVLFFVNVDA